jgi:hypothetical protein
MANNAQSFKAPQCEKRPQQTGAAAQKVSCRVFTRIHLSRPPPQRRRKTVLVQSSLAAIALGEARRHELDKFREPVTRVETEFRSTSSREKNLFWPVAMARANDAFGHSRLCASAVGGVTKDLLAKSERCTLVLRFRDQVRRGAN